MSNLFYGGAINIYAQQAAAKNDKLLAYLCVHHLVWQGDGGQGQRVVTDALCFCDGDDVPPPSDRAFHSAP